MEEKNLLMGSEITVRCLEEQGIKHVFSFPGGVVIPLFDAFYRLDHDITEIGPLLRTEWRACRGWLCKNKRYGRGCDYHLWPWGNHAVTGIANAYMDSVPLVVITGQVATPLLGRDSSRKLISQVSPCRSQREYLVTDVKDLADTIREAFVIAQSGRPAQ